GIPPRPRVCQTLSRLIHEQSCDVLQGPHSWWLRRPTCKIDLGLTLRKMELRPRSPPQGNLSSNSGDRSSTRDPLGIPGVDYRVAYKSRAQCPQPRSRLLQ